jgi:hypothetical protein
MQAGFFYYRGNMPQEPQKPANRDKAGRFIKGTSGNPEGRPRLPAELKEIKEASLQRAVEILHEKIYDEDYLKDLTPSDLIKFIETAFDRFGLPKVTKNEMTGEGGTPLLPPAIIFEASAKKENNA